MDGLIEDIVDVAKDELPELLLDFTVQKAVEKLYDKYDANKDGCLDKEECRKLAKDVAAKLGKADKFNEEYYACSFAAFAAGCDGGIDKEELIEYITNVVSQMLGLVEEDSD